MNKILLLLLIPSILYADEIPGWHMARKTMQKCYGGWDVEVNVSAGFETRYYQEGPVSGPTANAMLTVPLYSRKERLSRQEGTNKAIEHLAELYAEVESQQAITKSLIHESEILKKIMIDAGQQGIKAYFDLIHEIEKSKAKQRCAERKIIMILESCGYVAGDKATWTR
jgi:hypothetical protein